MEKENCLYGYNDLLLDPELFGIEVQHWSPISNSRSFKLYLKKSSICSSDPYRRKESYFQYLVGLPMPLQLALQPKPLPTIRTLELLFTHVRLFVVAAV